MKKLKSLISSIVAGFMLAPMIALAVEFTSTAIISDENFFDPALGLKEQSANPSALSSYGQLFTKTDNLLYYMDDSGTVTTVATSCGIALDDTDASNQLSLVWNEDDSSDRTLNFLVNSGDRSVDLSGNLTVEGASLIDQDLTTDASPTFNGATIGDNTAVDRTLTFDASANDGVFTFDESDDDLIWDSDFIVSGDFTVNGTTTTINTTTLEVEDKNITVANVGSPTDTTADGAGITIKGATDKTISWLNADDLFHFSDNIAVDEITEETTDAGVTIEGTRLENSYIQLDITNTTPVTEGQFAWDADDGAAVLGMAGAVNLNVGQELFYGRRVTNDDTVTLTNCMAVYVSGFTGNNPLAKRADNSTYATSNTIGLVTEDAGIATSQKGFITTHGEVNNCKTDYSGWTANDVLYLDTAGNLTDIIPTGSKCVAKIGKVGRVHATEGTIQVNIEACLLADEINSDYIGVPTYAKIQDYINQTGSAGWISGGAISDNGDGTVTVAAGTGMIRTTNDSNGELVFFDWAEDTSVSLTDEENNYIAVDYNAGTPQIISGITNTSNGNTIFNLGVVFREGTSADVARAGQVINDATKKIIQRLNADGNIVLTSGGVVSETGTRNLAVTAGVLYGGITRFTTSAIDTSGADTFEYYYTDGLGGWQYVSSTATQINNTQYDNAGTLTALTANRYRTDFLYLSHEGELLVLLGTNNSSLADAQAVTPPTSLPPHIAGFSTLIAKLIIQEGSATFAELDNVQGVAFTASGTFNHNDAGGLQGGAASEYYHLDATEFGYLDGQNQSVLIASDVSFNSVTSSFNGSLDTNVAAAGMTVSGTTIGTDGTDANIPVSIDVKGTAGSGYVEVFDDNNAGYLAIGKTTASTGGLLSITDGGSDNEMGKICLYEDDGNGSYLWVNTASVLRGSNGAPSDDDADGFPIMDLATGAINASSLEGTDLGTLTDTKICTYDVTGTEIDCDTTNAPTATALAANGADCSLGNAPLGVDASGAVESCFDVWTEAENTSAAYIANVSEDTTPQLGGDLDAGANYIGFTMQTVTYNGTTTTVDWSAGNKATMTFGAGNIGTLAFTDPPDEGSVQLIIIQDGTGSRTVTAWDTDIKWAGASAPTLSTDPDAIDIVSCLWNGTNYFCSASLDFQ